jgi:two-component system response regulator QseB
MTILVVEDEAVVAEVLRRALEGMGNAIVCAESAAAAERVLDERPVDAMTLDLTMPGLDGLDWLERLACARPELARRTLVVTGRQLESSAVTRLARCGAGALAKPFTMDRLEAAVRCQLRTAPIAPRRD